MEETIKKEIESKVKSSGSSFYFAMKLLPKKQREAMYAIYAFCREVDDIADEEGTADEKICKLNVWKEEIENIYAGKNAKTNIGKAILEIKDEYSLPKDEFLELIKGMETDALNSQKVFDFESLSLYCRRVAGTVGILTISVLGITNDNAKNFALNLGQAVQLTNILRDVKADEKLGRNYLPKELTDKKDLKEVCFDLADIAESKYKEAYDSIDLIYQNKLKPAIMMGEMYHQILYALYKVNFDWDKYKKPKFEMLKTAIKLWWK